MARDGSWRGPASARPAGQRLNCSSPSFCGLPDRESHGPIANNLPTGPRALRTPRSAPLRSRTGQAGEGAGLIGGRRRRGWGRRARPWQARRRPSLSPSRIQAHAAATAASPRPGPRRRRAPRGKWNSGTGSAPSDTCPRCCCTPYSSWPTVSAGSLLPRGARGVLTGATRAILSWSPRRRRKRRGRLHGLQQSRCAARARRVRGRTAVKGRRSGGTGARVIMRRTDAPAAERRLAGRGS